MHTNSLLICVFGVAAHVGMKRRNENDSTQNVNKTTGWPHQIEIHFNMMVNKPCITNSYNGHGDMVFDSP